MKYYLLPTLIWLLAGCQHTPNITQADSQPPTNQPSVACNDNGLMQCQLNGGEHSHPLLQQPFKQLPLGELTASSTEPNSVENRPEQPSPKQVDDLWQRIAMQLSLPVPNNKRVHAQRNWYAKHPNYMQRVSKRAEPFLHLIVEQIEQAAIPLEIALLPIVESAFDPFAYSHGRAAGMWQFVPGTGKRFGMKQNWWYDGRRDVLASTQGAIAYLKYLHNMFKGNWLHALAAYNSGEGRVLRAIRKNRKQGKSTDFWALDLPKETRAYVPKLLALADLLKHANNYAFQFPIIKNQPVLAQVETGSQIDLAMAADFADMSLAKLHSLNPAFNRWATDPAGPHYLLLPKEKASTFNQALANADAKDKLNWVRHKVKNGDSLLKLAKQYHTRADIIRQVNQLKGNTIRTGDHLVIPVALRSLENYSLSSEQRLASTQSKKRAAHQLSHKVKSGDTLWDISRTYKVNIRSLAKWNGMAPTDTLRPGKQLVIWINQTSAKQHANSVVRTIRYKVRKGDSLARIANRFKVKLADLRKWNQSKLGKYLQPGQTLKLFVDVTRS